MTPIEETPTYQRLVDKDKFMSKILLGKKSIESINHIVELIKMHGSEYINDKNFSEREVNIAREVLNLE